SPPGQANPPAGSLSTATIPTPFAATTADLVESVLLSSNEFFADSGGTQTGFLSALYKTALGRDLDAVGSTYWRNFLAAGHGRLEVAQSVLSSAEAQRTKVARWLVEDLGWTATLESLKALPLVSTWANLFASGVTESSIRALILSSQEAYDRAGGNDV